MAGDIRVSSRATDFGFRKSANRVEGYEAVADFLDLYLKKGD